jgi:hypothetical protein
MAASIMPRFHSPITPRRVSISGNHRRSFVWADTLVYVLTIALAGAEDSRSSSRAQSRPNAIRNRRSNALHLILGFCLYHHAREGLRS